MIESESKETVDSVNDAGIDVATTEHIKEEPKKDDSVNVGSNTTTTAQKYPLKQDEGPTVDANLTPPEEEGSSQARAIQNNPDAKDISQTDADETNKGLEATGDTNKTQSENGTSFETERNTGESTITNAADAVTPEKDGEITTTTSVVDQLDEKPHLDNTEGTVTDNSEDRPLDGSASNVDVPLDEKRDADKVNNTSVENVNQQPTGEDNGSDGSIVNEGDSVVKQSKTIDQVGTREFGQVENSDNISPSGEVLINRNNKLVAETGIGDEVDQNVLLIQEDISSESTEGLVNEAAGAISLSTDNIKNDDHTKIDESDSLNANDTDDTKMSGLVDKQSANEDIVDHTEISQQSNDQNGTTVGINSQPTQVPSEERLPSTITVDDILKNKDHDDELDMLLKDNNNIDNDKMLSFKSSEDNSKDSDFQKDHSGRSRNNSKESIKSILKGANSVESLSIKSRSGSKGSLKSLSKDKDNAASISDKSRNASKGSLKSLESLSKKSIRVTAKESVESLLKDKDSKRSSRNNSKNSLLGDLDLDNDEDMADDLLTNELLNKDLTSSSTNHVDGPNVEALAYESGNLFLPFSLCAVY